MARLTKREQAIYRAGGFRPEGGRLSAAAVARHRLAAAARILRLWGAGPHSIRATLNLPSARKLRRWRCGREAISVSTTERISVVFALYRRRVEGFDFPALKPLPPLKRPGRRPLGAQDLLAGGRLSDLLALLLQLVRAEEAAQAGARDAAVRAQRKRKAPR